ncbi:hypothetical protein [Streptomyces sp. NPDC059943]|uniref:hypothetical protein n=1 Tax=Streptomyces sp. NPDC059943 TaxID=3347010 RepID=UPI00365C10CD
MLDADSRTHISRCSMPNPAEAIRAIRVDVRALTDAFRSVTRGTCPRSPRRTTAASVTGSPR